MRLRRRDTVCSLPCLRRSGCRRLYGAWCNIHRRAIDGIRKGTRVRDNRSGMSHWHRRRRQGLSMGRRSLRVRRMLLWLLLLLLKNLVRRNLMGHLVVRLRRDLWQRRTRFRLRGRRMNNGDDSTML